MTKVRSTTEVLVELRSILAESPSAPGWEALCEVLDLLPANEASAVAVEYACGHLQSWPHRLRVAPRRWLSQAAEGLAEPRLAVAVTLVPSTNAELETDLRLLSHPGLRHIQSIAAPDLALDGRLLRRLGGGADLRRVSGLDLSASFVGDGVIECLVEILEPGRLRQLAIRGNRMSAAEAALLAHHPTFRGLERIDVRGCGLTDEGCQRLLHAEALATLRVEGNLLGWSTRREVDRRFSTETAEEEEAAAIDLEWATGGGEMEVAAASPKLRRARVFAGQTLSFARGSRADVPLRSPPLAAAHFEIEGRESGFVLRDLGTTGLALSVGGIVTGRVVLEPGDVIGVGEGTVFVCAAGEGRLS